MFVFEIESWNHIMPMSIIGSYVPIVSCIMPTFLHLRSCIIRWRENQQQQLLSNQQPAAATICTMNTAAVHFLMSLFRAREVRRAAPRVGGYSALHHRLGERSAFKTSWEKQKRTAVRGEKLVRSGLKMVMHWLTAVGKKKWNDHAVNHTAPATTASAAAVQKQLVDVFIDVLRMSERWFVPSLTTWPQLLKRAYCCCTNCCTTDKNNNYAQVAGRWGRDKLQLHL